MYKVVLIDDEPLVLVSLERRFDWEGHGFAVSGTARGAADGLKLIDSVRPNLVLTDVCMPQMNGLEMLRELRERYPDMLFAVLSGYSEFEYARAAIQQGVLDFCVKPVEEEELYALLDKARAILDKQGSGAESEEAQALEGRSDVLQKILLYIRENYRNPRLSTSLIAQALGFNANYVSQIFNKSEKETVTSYLTRFRLERACDLLKNSDYQVGQVAELVGYTDYFYFAKLFKRRMCLTPSEYRQQMRGPRSSGGEDAE